MNKIKQIDDAAIKIIMDALDRGVRLKDPSYEMMLEEYPHYKQILQQKEDQVKKMKKFVSDY